MMCLEWHLRSFRPFSFICCLIISISLHAHIEDNEHLKCVWGGGGGLEKSILCFLCFLFFFCFHCFLYHFVIQQSESFFSFSFICCLFVCISLHAHIEDNEHFKCRGGFRKNLSVFCFSILCFLFSVFIVSVSVFCFNFCVCIYFMFLFSYILFCLFFYICMLFCFFVVVFYFRFYVLLYVLCFVVLLFLHIEKNKDFVVVFC